MGTFIIDYGDKGPLIVDAYCGAFGYQTEIPDPENPGSTIPNPESKADFTKRLVKQQIRNVVKDWYKRQNQQDWEVNAESYAETETSEITVS